MAALDFPVSPSVGDTFTFGGKTWRWDGTKWTLVSSGGVGNGLVSKTEFIDVNTDGITGNWTRLNFMDVQGDLKAGRTYRIAASGWFEFTGGDGTANLLLCKGDSFGAGNANILSFERINIGSIAIDAGRRLWVEYLYMPTVDEPDQLFTAWGAFDASSGTMSHRPRTTAPAFFYIEDVTPSSGGGGGGGDFDGNHVLTGDPANPPAELLVNQLLWDGNSSPPSSGTPSVTPWTALPTYGSGWANYGAGWQAGQYRKVGDEVQLRGLLKYAFGGDSTPNICTLPTGFRPPANHLFICMGYTTLTANAGFRVSVNANGTMDLDISNSYQGDSINGYSVDYIDISQIRFSVTA